MFRNTWKRSLSLLLTLAMAVTLIAFGGTSALADLKEGSLDLDDYSDQWVFITGREGSVPDCYALLDVVYCENPADASVQQMDIYVPAAYMDAESNGDRTYTCKVKSDAVFEREDGVSYTAATAPIIYQNTIDGYRQGDSFNLTNNRKGSGVGQYYSYLESGYVLVSIGTRGINSAVDGTAPACVVDLKAGVRFLKANAGKFPGDTDKIIATGASAGGASTAILGASGNSPLYDPYLEEIGAADAADDIYCAMCFCPISDLDIADAALEWLHSSELGMDLTKMMGGAGGPGGGSGEAGGNNGGSGEAGGPGGGSDEHDDENGPPPYVDFDEFEVAAHDALLDAYADYLTDLGLDPQEYYDGFLAVINDSVQYYADNHVEDIDAFAEENPALERDGDSFSVGTVEDFVVEYMSRMKPPLAYDSINYTNSESQLYNYQHFSDIDAAVIGALSEEYSEAADAKEAYETQITDEQRAIVSLMSSIGFLSGENEGTVAPYWRFRNGMVDGDVGAVNSWTMTELLKKNFDIDADFALIWGVGHAAADYGYEDVQSYVDSICLD